VVRCEGIDVPLPGYAFRDRPQAGRPVMLGLRPEVVTEPGPRAQLRLAMDTVLVEPTGADTIVRLALGPVTLTGRFHPATRLSPGSAAEVGIDLAGASLFCAHAGTRL